jgi:hypothetical protein
VSESSSASSFRTVERLLAGWKPFADLAGTMLAAQILALLRDGDPELRRAHLASASDLYRLHLRYAELGLLREGRNERAEQFARLLALSTDAFAAAIARGEQKEPLALLQACFEFGRHEAQARNVLMRQFILTLLELDVGALGVKYSLYPGGVLYTTAGKTHDEMAQDLAKLGMGGAPIAGGTIARTGQAEFHYDMASTAYKATNDPNAVKEPLLRAVRVSGGREDAFRLQHRERLGV